MREKLPPSETSVATAASIACTLAVLATVLLAGLFTLQRFTDFDVLWHVRSGQWILEQWRIPRTDPFGEMTSGEPWLDVAWGAQVVGAGIVDAVGLTGLQLCTAALVAGTLLFAARVSATTPAALVALLLFTLTAWQRFLVRPDILSFPLTVVALALVDRLRQRPVSSMVLLVGLTAAWANIHGSFVLAPILVAAAIVGSLLGGAGTGALGAHMLLTLPLCLGAGLVNPYGWRLYTLLTPYARSLLAAAGLVSAGQGLDVSEWVPTWRVMTTDTIFPAIPFGLMIMLLAASFIGLDWRKTLPRMACGAALLLFAMTAVRNLLPFAAGALWIILVNERDRRARRGGAGRPLVEGAAPRLVAGLLVFVAAAWHVGAVVTDRFYVERDLPNNTGVGPYLDVAPEGAVQWIAAHEMVGRMFNNYNSGSYLLYRLYPHVRTYIDARLDTTKLYQEIGQAIRQPSAFQALTQRDGIGTIVLIHPSPESILLLPALAADPRWTMVYRDANTTIHVRSESSSPSSRTTPLDLKPAVEPAAVRINMLLARFKSHCLPASELTDAFVSAVLGDSRRQVEAYRRALARAPDNPQALMMLRQLGETAN